MARRILTRTRVGDLAALLASPPSNPAEPWTVPITGTWCPRYAMASRSVWSGFIQFSLVTVPVKAYTAAVSGGGGAPSLNQLHKDCNSRIQYKKTCPIHGDVPSDQIVSGYQFASDQYVIIDTDEIQKLRPKSAKNISIAAFVKPDAIDPSMYSGKSYYLLPDGPVAQRPYALLVKAMSEQRRNAFAQVVMSGRDKIMLVR